MRTSRSHSRRPVTRTPSRSPARRKPNAAPKVTVIQTDAARRPAGHYAVFIAIDHDGGRVSRSFIANKRGVTATPIPAPLDADPALRKAVADAVRAAVQRRLARERAAEEMAPVTMDDVRRGDPGHFRDTSEFGGGCPGSKFFGPYVGPGGTYFVQEYPTPSEFRTRARQKDWAISQFVRRGQRAGVDRTDIDDYKSRADAIFFARELALGDD